MSSLIRGLSATFEPGNSRLMQVPTLVALMLMVHFNLKALQRVAYAEGDVIGVVQFRSTVS